MPSLSVKLLANWKEMKGGKEEDGRKDQLSRLMIIKILAEI
jgi:hypothetical protein